MSRSTERARAGLLAEVFGAAPAGWSTGIGDDAAVLEARSGPLCWSIDEAVEGVHFARDLMTLEDAGYRATMAALSDLAAMGARPEGVLASLVLPADLDDAALLAVARGQRDAASDAGTAVVGGNLARGERISIATTVLGAAAKPLLRAGARPGDALWLAGHAGWAAAGLACARGAVVGAPHLERALVAFRRPRALIDLGAAAAQAGASAMVDLSDGLATDARHIAQASGVAVVLDAPRLADAELAELAKALGREPLDWVLFGGEDYALLAAAPTGVELEGFARVGACVEGAPSVSLRTDAGSLRSIPDGGFDHFGP